MKTLIEKIKLVIGPFIRIAVFFIAAYTFFHWLLIINLRLFVVKDMVVNLWLPLCLPIIPVFIWLKPRLKHLQFKKDGGSFGFLIFSVFAIAAPTMIAQAYLESATGKLTKLNNMHQIETLPETRYYAIKNSFIDKNKASFYSTSEVSGKYNNRLTFFIYAVIPIFDTHTDTTKGECSNWMGIKYSKTISNRLSNSEKEANFREFGKETENELYDRNLKQFVYLEKLGNSNDVEKYSQAIRKSDIVAYHDPVILLPRNEPFEKRNGNKLAWVFLALLIGTVILTLFLLTAKIRETQLQKVNDEEATKDTSLKEMLNLFIPKQGFYITPILINMNILVFAVMVISGLGFISFKATDLVHWGGNYRPLTAGGEWWRLLTNIFLHGGIMHLFANMYGLLFVGVFLEPLLGKLRYLITYLLTGLLASCTSMWWHDATVSVGASGAIFGLYGLFIALMLMNVYSREFSKGFLAGTLFFVGFNLVLGLTGGIDNAAHLGGLLSGFIVGLLLSSSLKRKNEELINVQEN